MAPRQQAFSKDTNSLAEHLNNADEHLSQPAIENELAALERGLNLHKQLEAALRSYLSPQKSLSDRQLQKEAVLSHWAEQNSF